VQTSLADAQASSVECILFANDVWYDDQVVRAAVQVRDIGYNVQTNPRSVRVQVQPSSKLRQLNNIDPTATCTSSSTDGSCRIDIQLPQEWFQQVTIDANNFVTILYGLDGNSLATLQTVAIHPVAPTSLNLTDSVFAQLPGKPVFVGNSYSIPIVVRTQYIVDTLQVRVTVDGNLLVTSITPQAAYLGSASIPTEQLSGSGSFVLQDTNPSKSPVNSDQQIAVVVVTVPNGAALDSLATIRVNVTFLSDVLRRQIVRVATGAGLYGRLGWSTGVGGIFVASDAIQGVLPYPSQGDGEHGRIERPAPELCHHGQGSTPVGADTGNSGRQHDWGDLQQWQHGGGQGCVGL